MNIGDKVRLLRGTEEGVIVKIVNDTTVEIEIEDGFSFPVLRSEVVIVSKTEAEHFSKPASQPGSAVPQRPMVRETTVVAETGIYLAFEPKGDIYTVWLVNNTDYTLAFKIDELLHGTTIGINSAVLGAKSIQPVASKSSKTFENWADIQFTCLYFQNGVYKSKPAFSKQVQFRAAAFMKKKGGIPLSEKEGYVYQLDAEMQAGPTATTAEKQQHGRMPSAEEIKEQMLSPKTTSQPGTTVRPEHRVVDLHLEKLLKPNETLPVAGSLGYQLEVFEKELDTAVATGQDEITFVHGVGNGVLREEIHKRLSKMKNILYFQDAQKERFGYGATLIKIKN